MGLSLLLLSRGKGPVRFLSRAHIRHAKVPDWARLACLNANSKINSEPAVVRELTPARKSRRRRRQEVRDPGSYSRIRLPSYRITTQDSAAVWVQRTRYKSQ